MCQDLISNTYGAPGFPPIFTLTLYNLLILKWYLNMAFRWSFQSNCYSEEHLTEISLQNHVTSRNGSSGGEGRDSSLCPIRPRGFISRLRYFVCEPKTVLNLIISIHICFLKLLVYICKLHILELKLLGYIIFESNFFRISPIISNYRCTGV